MIGGRDNDLFVVDSLLDTIVEKLGEGSDTAQTVLSAYSLAGIANVENLTFTGSGPFHGRAMLWTTRSGVGQGTILWKAEPERTLSLADRVTTLTSSTLART